MKAKKGRAVCLTVSLILLTAALAHIFFPQLNNWKLLLAGERNTYTLCQPLKSTEEMMEEFFIKSNMRFGSINGPETITPTMDIHYYSSPDGLTPVYTLKAGHSYALLYTDGYGFVTWPTYSSEWRYTRPFIEVNKEEYLQSDYIPHEEFEALPDCYIRLSDLESLCSGEASILDMEAHQTPYPRLFDLDTFMYRIKYCYSPNLPIFLDIWNISFLAAGLLLLGLTILWMR